MRTLATFGSFAILLGLYFLYGWVLVPNLLPLPVEKSVEIDINDNVARDEAKPYHFLLPENSWERNPETELQYLKFGETILLFGKDTPSGNIVKLEPCTVLMVPGIDDSNLSEEQHQDCLRQAIVLRTPQYAEIEFNREFNLSQISSLEIVGGRLIGKVTVESDMKASGPVDDIFLETEDILISMANPAVMQISTIKDVRFRFGYHTGEGSMLNMELKSVNPKNPKSEKQLSRVQFERMKRLDLVFPENAEAAPKIVADAGGNSIQGRRILPSGPATFLNIKCQRQFSFFSQKPAGSWVARFLGNVEMARTTPDGLTDQLYAEEVLLDFQEKKPVPVKGKSTTKATATATPKSAPAEKMGDLEPVLFKALGRLAQGNQPNIPARLVSRRNGGILMKGDQILYDLRKNYLTLETQTASGASPEVEILLENRYHIRGQKGFEYTMGGDDDVFGRLVSFGKGTLAGKLGEAEKARDFFLSWNLMQIAPDPEKSDQIILKLWDGVAADIEGLGKMTAGRLDLWCRSTPRPASTPTTGVVVPKPQDGTLPGLGETGKIAGMKAQGNLQPVDAVVSDKVRFENGNGVCNVNRLDIIFVEPLQAPDSLSDSSRTVQVVGTDRFVSPRTVRLAQHTQSKTGSKSAITAPAPASPQIPLYEAKPHAPVASQAPVAPSPTRGATPVSTRNLLGLNSNGSPAGYEINGDTMRMRVAELPRGGSHIEVLKIEGDVRIVETLLDRSKGEIIEVYGEEISVWNPSTEAAQILILGSPRRDAEFKGRGVQMIAREINISRPENKIWSEGMGRLIIQSGRTDSVLSGNGANNSATAPTGLKPLKSAATASPTPSNTLAVEWNKDMRTDGKTIIFRGVLDKSSNRVRAVFQDKNIWCNVMEIHLNRLVNFFEKEDPDLVAPEADTVQCLHDVHVLVREKDEAGRLKSVNEGRFETLTYQVKMNYFVATALGLGELRRTFLSSDKGFGDTKSKLPVAASTKKADGGEGLNFLSVWFQQNVRGTLQPDYLDVEINGRVQTAFCPVETWDDVIGFDNIKAARRLGYILECEKLRLHQMPDPLNPKQGVLELRAQENAVIDGSRIYGSAREIKYNQARSLVIFEGNAKFHTTDDGKPISLAAEAFEYNFETGAHGVRQSAGGIIGQ